MNDLEYLIAYDTSETAERIRATLRGRLTDLPSKVREFERLLRRFDHFDHRHIARRKVRKAYRA